MDVTEGCVVTYFTNVGTNSGYSLWEVSWARFVFGDVLTLKHRQGTYAVSFSQAVFARLVLYC